MASFFTVGTYIEICTTDNVLSRFPDLIGAIGVVELAPVHPSTWFTIKVVEGGRLVKLQTTAMKPILDERTFSRTILSQQSHNEKAIAKPISVIPTEHTEQRPRALSNVGIAHFVKGVAVKILGTNNVLQRVPHLVGVVGHIKDVPVHPITWFKIEFPTGQVVTFRPSAFKLDDGRDEVVINKPLKKAPTPEPHEGKKPATLTKDADSDFTVGMRVRIRSGELSGATGEIMRFGNGWIQVLTSEGKTAKRAHELDFVDAPNQHQDPRGSVSIIGHSRDLSAGGNISDFDTRRSKSGRVIKSHLQHNPNQENEHGDFGSMQSTKRQRSNAESSDSCENTYPSNCQIGAQMKHNKHGHMRPSSRHPTMVYRELASHDLETFAANCPFPLISLQLRQAKRVQTQQYVDRETSFSDGRPDLSYWLDQIKGAIFEKDVASDSESTHDNCSVSDCNEEVRQDFDERNSPEINVVENTTPVQFTHDDSDCVPTTISKVDEGRMESAPLKSTSIILVIKDKPHFPSIPQGQDRPRSESLCETDCEDSMSPNLIALNGSLSHHQKEVKPSMLTHMLLPPPYPAIATSHPVKSMDVLFDKGVSEPCPARFFISSASITSPRDSARSKEFSHVPKDHEEWSSFLPLEVDKPLVYRNLHQNSVTVTSNSNDESSFSHRHIVSKCINDT